MVDKIDKERMATQYGFALAFMKSSPELWKLFNQAVKQTWTADRFIAGLRNTKWFQHHSASVRNAILQQTSDPAEYQAQVNQMAATVRDAWGSMFGSVGMNDRDINQWAETAHRLGWSQAQLIDHMVQGMNFRKLLKKRALGGSAAELEGQVTALTKAYGLDLGKNWVASQVKAVTLGNDTIAGIQQRVRELAAREYKAFGDAIQGGQTVQDVAEPYIQKMASLLEVNPSDISLTDKTIQAALKQRTKDGRPAAMDLADFGDFVRKDKRWQFTDNAREEMASVTAQLAQAFGGLG